jgi:uncharacterized protein YkwD
MYRCMLLILGIACTLPPGSAPAVGQDKDKFMLSKEEQQLLDLTNQERKKAKLPPLKANAVLCKVARAHSANMAKQGKMEHKLDGKDVFARLTAAAYDYAVAGENLARGEDSLEDVVAEWMKSKGHRENILADDFTEIGLGLAKAGNGRIYYTQVFADPQK